MGLIDGTRAALLQGLDAVGLLACVGLVLGLDMLVGGAAGGAAALLAGLARWGRAAHARNGMAMLSWAVAGAGAAGAAAAAAAATGLRNNRFLAAGVVALVSAVAGVVGALVAPALARTLGRPRAAPARGGVTPAGLLLAAPLAALVLEVAPFLALSRAPAPLRGSDRIVALALAAATSTVLPLALARASRRWPSVGLGRAAAAAVAAFVVPAVLLVRARWTTDFQFVRWNDVAVAGALAITFAGCSRWLGRRGWPARVLPVALGAPALAVALVLGAGASEPARKAAAARAGLAAPILAAARVPLDRDRDGYTRLLGGGDCDDGDPDVNPAAQEWPDDGIDQDCDGKDATAAFLRPPPPHPVPETVPRDPNVLFVTIDTLRADRLGCYGYGRETSPEIDDLASDGMVFENGWAHSPSTRYAMPALATARWPSAIAWQDCAGCEIWWPRIAASQRTIGEAFKREGYTTGALYAYSYFKRAEARGFERGIDVYEDRRADLHRNISGPPESTGSSAREIADDAIAFLDAHKERKHFLWLHFYDPHLAYERHAGAPSFGDTQSDLYDGEIWHTDHHLGRVLSHLKQLRLWDRTVIFVTGDHGEGLGERGIRAHGYHLYGPQTKVPFVARVPGLGPRRVATPVGHVDIAPTLLNLARGAPEPGFLGRSMVDLMTGAPTAPPPAPVLQEVTYECATGMDCTRRRALVTATHHLIWNWMPENTTECYDLRADPGELRDLWGTAAGRACGAIKADLRDRMAALALPPDFAQRIAGGVSAPGAAVPPPTHSRPARIGRAVGFLGTDVEPARIVPGGHVDVVYHFESLERLRGGWRTFVHMEGPGGFRNLDHVPVEGAYPLERWRPGQRIRDRQRITFPPSAIPGTYTLYVGIFRGLERQPVTPADANDGQNRIRAAAIVVQ